MQRDDIHERASGVFAPDTLLPGQYFDRIRRGKDLTGEQRLMIAVLDSAVDDFLKHVAARDRLRQGLFAEAERWIESTDRSCLYAFETICDYLGLDVDYVRRGLRERRERVRDPRHGAASPMPADAAPADAPPARRWAGNE
jgi:hypothetical protein